MKRSRSRSPAEAESSHEVRPFKVKRDGVLRVQARGKRGAVRPQAPFLDQQEFVAIDGNAGRLRSDDRERPRGLLQALLEETEIGQQGSCIWY